MEEIIMQEIAMNILDIAYNSIRAKATFIQILILDSSKQNVIEIKIIDNGCGMDQNNCQSMRSFLYN